MRKAVFVIAEAGVNHNGSCDMALQLVDAAAHAGADAVKFQTFKTELLATPRAEKANYQVTSTGASGTQIDMLRRLELSPADHGKILERCRAHGILFMSTAFDASSLELLAALDIPAVKIPSGDITYAALLLQAARLRRRLIVSTGMATLADIEQALGVIAFGLTIERQPSGRADFDTAYASADGRAALEDYVTLLHCVTEYPAPVSSVNLRAMDAMAAAFGLPVGYSDHTKGFEVAIAAVARGATVIEKHFTLDNSLPGPDHAASLEPAGLIQLVAAIRNVEKALGTAIKAPTAEEVGNRLVARRSLVAAQPIAKGAVFTFDMLTAKRPSGGLSPMEQWSLVGRRATRDYLIDDPIEQ